MVKRLFSFITKQYGSIHQAALLLGFFSLSSQLLGLIRDRALVSQLGPSLSLDVYYASFRIPDFVFTTLASLVAVTAIIPFLVEKIDKKDGGVEARAFMDRIFSAFLIAITIACIGVFIAMPFLANIVTPGFSLEGKHLLISMSRIMLLSPILLGLQNLLGSVVQMHKKFFVYAIAPVFYNSGILIGVFFFYPIFGIYGLAYGVILGALMHLSIQLPVVWQLNFMPQITWRVDWMELWDIIKIAMPRTFTLAGNTIITLVLTAIASSLSTGSISILTFSLNLQSVPIMLISVSYAIAAFPSLVETYATGKREEFMNLIRGASQQIIFWSLPITALFIVLRAHIVRIVYGTAALSWNDTRITAALFAVLAISVVAQSLTLVFIRAYYASGKTAKPFILTLAGGIITCILAVLFTHIGDYTPVALVIRDALRLVGVQNISIIGLGIAYTIGQFFTLGLFWFFFRRDFDGHMLTSLTKTIWTSILGAVVLGVVSHAALGFIDQWISLNTFWGVFVEGTIAGVSGIICAFIVLYLCKSEELKIFLDALRSRFWKSEVIMPGQENFE